MGLQQLAHAGVAAYTSSLRGDVTTERFSYPKAMLTLADHPHRRSLAGHYMAARAAENQLSLERMEALPRGQRFQAGVEYMERLKVARRSQEEAEEAELHSKRPLRPEQLTSADNPLAKGWSADKSAHSVAIGARTGSSDLDFDSEEDGDASEAEEPAGGVAGAGARAGAQSSGGGEIQEPGAESVAAGVLRGRKAQAQRRKAAAEHHRAINQDGHLEPGSLSPRKGACAGPGEDSDIASANGRGAAEALERLHMLEEAQERLEREWPHGVPRRIAAEMRALGLRLPTPGFGDVSSCGPLQVTFSSRG